MPAERRTVLEIGNNVALQLRFDEFDTLVGNVSKNAKTVLLAIRQGLKRDVFWFHPWSMLRRKLELSFAADKDFYILPTDFDHLINDTAWDLIRRRPAVGPLSSPQWAALISDGDTVSPDSLPFTIAAYEEAGSIIGGGSAKIGYQQALWIYPTPTSNSPGVALRAAYISNEVLRGTNGLAKTEITDDRDVPILDPDLIEQAAYVRALRMLGLNFADEMDELQEALKNRARKDGGYMRMNMSMTTDHRYAYPNTPGHYRALGRLRG